MRPWTLLIGLALLGACDGDDDAPEGVAEVDDVWLDVPAGWTVETGFVGSRRMLIMRDGGGTSFCRVSVVRDGNIYREEDVRAMVGIAKERYRVGAEEPDRIEAPIGVLEGVTSREVDLTLAPLTGRVGRERWFGAWAGRRERRLFGAVAGSSDAAADPAGAIAACRDALATLRLP